MSETLATLKAAGCPEHLQAAGINLALVLTIFNIVKAHAADLAAAWKLVQEIIDAVKG